MPIAPAAALWEATPWSRQSALEKRAHPEHREAMSHIGWLPFHRDSSGTDFPFQAEHLAPLEKLAN